MSEIKQSELQEIHTWDEVPKFQSEAEEAEFWATHCLGDELLAEMTPMPDDIFLISKLEENNYNS